MIEPAVYDLTLYQGATFEKQFTVKTNGTAVNWTGYTGQFEVKQVGSDAVVFDIVPTLGGAAGTISITITAAASTSTPPGAYTYNLKLTSGTYVTWLLRGTFTVIAESSVS
jgi:hypothetical protein